MWVWLAIIFYAVVVAVVALVDDLEPEVRS